jgi:hypothetical protein
MSYNQGSRCISYRIWAQTLIRIRETVARRPVASGLPRRRRASVWLVCSGCLFESGQRCEGSTTVYRYMTRRSCGRTSTSNTSLIQRHLHSISFAANLSLHEKHHRQKVMSNKQRNILILGASGRTGRIVVSQALERGFTVTVLVRKATAFEESKGLRIVEGSPLQLDDLKGAATAAGPLLAIVSTLGQTRASGNPWSKVTSPPALMTDSIKNAIEVAKGRNIPKIVIMSLFGVGDSWKNMNLMIKGVFRHSNMWQTVEDGNGVDEVVKASGLNFVLVRSTALMGTEPKPVQQLGEDGEKAGFMPSISTPSVAGFLLDAVEKSTWDRHTPVISN